MGRARRILVVAAIAVAVVVPCVAAYVATPGAGDLAARMTALARANGARPVSLDAIAPVMREAVVATEDERFWRHHGIDSIGVARAAAFDVTHLSLSQGASTITEQLAKELYLGGNDHSPWRKLEAAALALKIERVSSKDVILADYLNTVYFGQGAFGVAVASRRYFGAPASSLDLAQASLLAGLIQAPSADDPYVHPRAARARQVEVLTSMVRNGDVTTTEAERAIGVALPLAHGAPLPPDPAAIVDGSPRISWVSIAVVVVLVLTAVGALVWRRRHPDVGLSTAIRVGAYAAIVVAIVAAARGIRMD